MHTYAQMEDRARCTCISIIPCIFLPHQSNECWISFFFLQITWGLISVSSTRTILVSCQTDSSLLLHTLFIQNIMYRAVCLALSFYKKIICTTTCTRRMQQLYVASLQLIPNAKRCNKSSNKYWSIIWLADFLSKPNQLLILTSCNNVETFM